MAIQYTSADLDALKEALLTGAEEVRIGDRIVKYRSQEKLLQLIKTVQAYLDGQAASCSSSVTIQSSFKKGRVK